MKGESESSGESFSLPLRRTSGCKRHLLSTMERSRGEMSAVLKGYLTSSSVLMISPVKLRCNKVHIKNS